MRRFSDPPGTLWCRATREPAVRAARPDPDAGADVRNRALRHDERAALAAVVTDPGDLAWLARRPQLVVRRAVARNPVLDATTRDYLIAWALRQRQPDPVILNALAPWMSAAQLVDAAAEVRALAHWPDALAREPDPVNVVRRVLRGEDWGPRARCEALVDLIHLVRVHQVPGLDLATALDDLACHPRINEYTVLRLAREVHGAPPAERRLVAAWIAERPNALKQMADPFVHPVLATYLDEAVAAEPGLIGPLLCLIDEWSGSLTDLVATARALVA